MPKSEFEGVRVTVVDNYQGEENIFHVINEKHILRYATYSIVSLDNIVIL
jgi:hypothetical protein